MATDESKEKLKETRSDDNFVSQLLTELKEEDEEFEKNRRITKGKILPSIHKPIDSSIKFSNVSKASEDGNQLNRENSFDMNTI